MKKNSIALLLMIGCAGAAMAVTGAPVAISTQEMVAVCGDQSYPEPQIYCDVYGQGVYDSYLVTRYPVKAPEFICVVQPAQSRREVMGEFVEWSKRNPQYNTAPAADTLLRFLAIKFPCNSTVMAPANAVNKIVR